MSCGSCSQMSSSWKWPILTSSEFEEAPHKQIKNSTPRKHDFFLWLLLRHWEDNQEKSTFTNLKVERFLKEP